MDFTEREPSDLEIALYGSKRLAQQIAFVVELDKLKQVVRRTPLIDQSRPENDAEHSWHIAVMALILAEFAAPSVDIFCVIKMLLIHDIVEIDAGDTFLYDEVEGASQIARETRAARRLFGLLPLDQADTFRQIWEEFESGITPNAKFARALDRLQPLLHNYYTQGGTWRSHNVAADQVRERKNVEEASSQLGALAQRIIEDAVRRGYLRPE